MTDSPIARSRAWRVRLRYLLRSALGRGGSFADGRRFFRDLDGFVRDAMGKDRATGEVHLDVRVSDRRLEHPVSKSAMEAAYAARAVARWAPRVVHDVGSNLIALATLSAFVDVVGLDARKIEFEPSGLRFTLGTAERLPYDDESVEFMTSLCVVEHIGLGRYGDPLDANGDLAFMDQARRCLRPGGHFVLSVPVALERSVRFNAHRVYGLEDLSVLAGDLVVEDEAFIHVGAGFLGRSEAVNVLRGGGPAYLVWISTLRKPGAGSV